MVWSASVELLIMLAALMQSGTHMLYCTVTCDCCVNLIKNCIKMLYPVLPEVCIQLMRYGSSLLFNDCSAVSCSLFSSVMLVMQDALYSAVRLQTELNLDLHKPNNQTALTLTICA